MAALPAMGAGEPVREDAAFQIAAELALDIAGNRVAVIAPVASQREPAEPTQSMATKAFGDGTIYLERYIERARHVAMQVFGFGDGHGLHLYERDCSIRRRYQKVIEESLAPGLTEDVRARMAEAATRLCREQQYAGAGTIEFVVDSDTLQFYFLEMNTRIEVEHPATEMNTGHDLVAMQIEYARGRLRHLEQAAINTTGHAIECGLYSENPVRNFIPAPGRLVSFDGPESSGHLRIDTGFRSGDEITHFYDPLIAKVICHGASRDDAIERILAALDAIGIEGPTTNLRFLRATVDHPAFREGRVFTGFIEYHKAELLSA